MLPPQTKSLINLTVQKYASHLKRFKNSNPVIMLGQLKLDRIDHKILKEAIKLNQRELNKDVKIQGRNRKYEKRKAAITYRSYTVQFKRKLIQKIRELNSESNVGLSKIIRAKARELNIHPKNIFRWFHTKQIKKKEGGRKALYPEMQERLAQFIINNPKMKRKHILRQAKEIMEDLKIPGREYFNFSKGWYERFRQRLVRRKILSGKIEVKRQFESQNQDSDFDDSIYSVKKQEYFFKEEHGSVKIENFSQQSEGYNSGEEKQQTTNKSQSKNEKKEQDSEEFVIFYEAIIENQNLQSKNKKQFVCQRTKKQQDEEKKEAKTDQSSQKCFAFDISQEKEANISIFASDEQNKS